MTATERRYRGESDEILSMEDPDDYGETLHKLSFKKALEYKPAILSDYKVVTIHISQEEIADLVRNRAFVSPKMRGWGKEMEAENLAALIALRKAMSKYPIRHAVSFHGSIKRAEEFQESNDAYSKSFPSSGRLQTFHVSGKTPTGTRAKEIDQFSRATRGLITNARCLTEGVDVPNIDAVLFADPRKSLVDIVQAVGRALRPSPQKKVGYVIVPVVHEKDARPEDIFESDSFKEVLTTLRALGSQDDRIIDYFRDISEGKPRRNKWQFEGVLTEKLAKKINLKEFVNSIQLRCWNRLANLSWRQFKKARAYIHTQNIKSVSDYQSRLHQLPKDIPKYPQKVYLNSGWVSWGDWLNTGFVAVFNRQFWPFKKARAYARSLGLKNVAQWFRFTKKSIKNRRVLPQEVPTNPSQKYRHLGWKSWGDWLGSENISHSKYKWREFSKARKYVHSLRLKSEGEYIKFARGFLKVKKPSDIPVTPRVAYNKKGWVGMADWLGLVKSRRGEWRKFIKARQWVRKLHLKNQKEWVMYTKNMLSHLPKRPLDIPTVPERVYRSSGWKGLGDWLGTGAVATRETKYKTFYEARKYVRRLKLKTLKEWRLYAKGALPRYCKRPTWIPSSPLHVYKHKGWISMGDWLGTGYVHTRERKYLAFKKAKKEVRDKNITNTSEYRLLVISKTKGKHSKQANMPLAPSEVYKDKGWRGWADFLGTKRKSKC